MLRLFKRAFRRAGIDLAYSQGFNPHPKMVFTQPLSIGVESVTEYVDIPFTESRDPEVLKAAINAQLPAQLQVVAIYQKEKELHEVDTADYRYVFADVAKQELENALAGSLEIEKKSKKGMIMVDLKEKLRTYSVYETDKGTVLTIRMDASQVSFVNPENLVKAIEANLARELTEYTIMKEACYLADGSEFK
jgi:radical SAM-linked protein